MSDPDTGRAGKSSEQGKKSLARSIAAWFDADASAPAVSSESAARFSWLRCMPFIGIHLGCLGALYTGASAAALWTALFWYLFRVFALTAFYHRYFSHRAFKTGRIRQFVFAIMGMTAIQRGPLWWAAHHRRHHLYADTEQDAHSPLRGVLWSHFGWFTCEKNFSTHYSIVRDFARYPELVFLNRFDWIVPVLFLAGLWGFGEWLAAAHPDMGTNGLQMVVWSGFISTVAVYHVTFCVNSLCHLLGRRPYASDDHSRNNWLVAIFTFGEGWHNNHHRYPGSARQGFRWWEIDITYQILRVLAFLRVISNLKKVPEAVVREGRPDGRAA